MLVVASSNAAVGIDIAWNILESGGSALDAVEAATCAVEDNPLDHTVGYGGYPNVLGEVELDASIMDGATRKAGAVGALRGYRHPITLARKVMEELPHVLLVGTGAARFAAELGLEEKDMLSAEAAQVWRTGLTQRIPAEYRDAAGAIQTTVLRQATTLAVDPERVAGTVNVIAQDRQGHIASAVSTSGWAWKYPGRLGDSPLIGAGNYADDRYGAATCTGWGELAIRAGTARSVVLYLKLGYSLKEACYAAFDDLRDLASGTSMLMHLVAIDHQGQHCALSTVTGREYVYRTASMDAYTALPRLVIPMH